MRALTKVYRVNSVVVAVGLALVLMSGPELFGGRRAKPERNLRME